jgi:hypothetical protein
MVFVYSGNLHRTHTVEQKKGGAMPYLREGRHHIGGYDFNYQRVDEDKTTCYSFGGVN